MPTIVGHGCAKDANAELAIEYHAKKVCDLSTALLRLIDVDTAKVHSNVIADFHAVRDLVIAFLAIKKRSMGVLSPRDGASGRT